MSHHDAHHDDAHGLAHVMPIKTLFAVFATLVVLTAVTVLVAQFDVGRWDIGVAMLIATVKATVVALYFMHLRYDKALNTMVFIASLVFVAIFMGFSSLDVFQYSEDVESYQSATTTTPQNN